MTVPILPGAEPFSAAGDHRGALILHGFTGSPQSVRGLAEAFAAAGFTVELPRLPGHGTSVDDMVTTDWADWSAAAEGAYLDLVGRCSTVVVAGLSMGGTLACWLATRHPEIAGIVLVNPAVQPDDGSLLELVDGAIAGGMEVMAAVGGDVAKEGVVELAYDAVPTRGMRSLVVAIGEMQDGLAVMTTPVLLMVAPDDHVVAPVNGDHLAATVAGPVERVSLDRSFHVATIDHDAELIQERAVAFACKVTASTDEVPAG